MNAPAASNQTTVVSERDRGRDLPGDPHDDGGRLSAVIEDAPILPRSSQEAFFQAELLEDRERAKPEQVDDLLADSRSSRHGGRGRQRMMSSIVLCSAAAAPASSSLVFLYFVSAPASFCFEAFSLISQIAPASLFFLRALRNF